MIWGTVFVLMASRFGEIKQNNAFVAEFIKLEFWFKVLFFFH